MPMLRKDMQCPAAVMLMLLVDEVLARLAAGAMVFHPVLLRVMKEMAVVEMAVSHYPFDPDAQLTLPQHGHHTANSDPTASDAAALPAV
eukprot:1157588-Pelagomonas_calceolata.AAC.1